MSVPDKSSFIDTPAKLDENGKSSLHILAAKNDAQKLEVILSNHPEWVDVFSESLDTPLHFASWQKNTASMKTLLAFGANPNAQNYKGQTPFHHAVSQGFAPSIEMLALAGARWDVIDHDGATPLGLWAQPRVQALRRSKETDPDLLPLLASLLPETNFNARICLNTSDTLREGLIKTHGLEWFRSLESSLLNHRLSGSLPKTRSSLRTRL